MSSYGVIWPSFWDSRTGKALVRDVKHGHPEPALLACYLMTCKHANLLGAFAMPLLYITHELGLPPDKAERSIERLQQLDWLLWDGDLEIVWVKEMARIRMNLGKPDPPSSKDNRVVAATRIYESLPSQVIVDGVFARYGKELKLKRRTLQPRLPEAPWEAPSEAPSQGRKTASGTVQNSTRTVQNRERTHRPVPVSGRPEHKGHAFCSERYCVPQQLHDEFAGRIGGAAISLPAWYLQIVSELGDQPCLEKTFEFWKTRFDRDIVPRLKDAGAIDMLPPRDPPRSGNVTSIDRANARARSAVRSAPIAKRLFSKE